MDPEYFFTRKKLNYPVWNNIDREFNSNKKPCRHKRYQQGFKKVI
jgi:hypothetical protein